MSDAPETNEAQFQHDTFNGVDPWAPATGRYILVVPAKLSRKLERERDEARAKIERLREALQRLADCDWVITPHDRMDAVRTIAREALAKNAETK